ncbi:unnamed protein product [Penicillium glandicola]
MADTGLPTGWEVRHSNSKNLPYYFNPSTKESRWEPPAETDTEKLKFYMAQNHTPAARPDASGEGEGKIRCSHLLVKHRDSRRPSSWREADIIRTKEQAIEILKGHEQRIQSGEITLGDLAVSESDCSSARKKGDLGFFGRGEMQKEFEDAAFGLQPGEVSSIIETASGVHLIERVTLRLRQRRSMLRLLNQGRSILEYTFDPNDFVVPQWILAPPEVRNAMITLRYRAMVAIYGMKSLMLARDTRYFALCPKHTGSLTYQLHQSSMRRLLEWKEDWDFVDPTLAAAVKIPRDTLQFCVDSIAYGKFTCDYTNKIDGFMSGAFQSWRQLRTEIGHLAFRLMSHKPHDYKEWCAWWEGKFADDMWKWEVCLEGLILPTWEEIIDDVYLMISDRVEDAQALANSFYISSPELASTN